MGVPESRRRRGERKRWSDSGWFLGVIDRDTLNQMSIVYRYWRGVGMMHMETEGKHLVIITSGWGRWDRQSCLMQSIQAREENTLTWQVNKHSWVKRTKGRGQHDGSQTRPLNTTQKASARGLQQDRVPRQTPWQYHQSWLYRVLDRGKRTRHERRDA